jgi:hypothetical protein
LPERGFGPGTRPCWAIRPCNVIDVIRL